MRKNLLVILSVLVLAGMVFFSCGQAAAGGGSGSTGGGTTETKASIKFVRLGGTAPIIMDLYPTKTSAGILIPQPGVDPTSTYDYTKFTPGTYYVGWNISLKASWPLCTFEKGKTYTATLNVAEDTLTVTVDP